MLALRCGTTTTGEAEAGLTVGVRGPILLEDYQLVEKLANFDRERIPERVVHARGASAKGFFEASAFGARRREQRRFVSPRPVHVSSTPLIVRFSTVIHERGSPETLRDPRGFAVKFYTRGSKRAGNHIQEGWRIADFFSHHPESMHMFTFLLDDVGVPLNYRRARGPAAVGGHMEGFGVHTFVLVNGEGRETLIKFHWKPSCGVKCLLEDEAVTVGGTNHSHATQDLYDSIARGEYPEWRLFIQTMRPEARAGEGRRGWGDADSYEFDPLDVTKTWPEDRFPLQVNYFPSRFDPARHAERYPIPSRPVSGRRERDVIPKENNFQQPGERFRSWDPARQQRFINRVADMLLDPRCTQEIRRVWLGYLTQSDKGLGQQLAAKLQLGGAL
eukprot:scaffold12.g7959.t1